MTRYPTILMLCVTAALGTAAAGQSTAPTSAAASGPASAPAAAAPGAKPGPRKAADVAVLEPDLTRTLMAAVTAERLQKRVDEIFALGSRVVGQPGHQKIVAQLDAWRRDLARRYPQAGLQLLEQPFPAVAPVVIRPGVARLPDGSTLDLAPVWPNGVMPTMLPEGGLDLRVVDAGSGLMSEYDGQRVEGAAVLLDMRSGTRWHTAAMLGARVVLFYLPDRITTGDAEACFSNIPVNVPRFVITMADRERLRAAAAAGQTVHFDGAMDWARVECRNLITIFPGKGKLARQLMVVSAPMDAMSVTPTLPGGAETSIGLVQATQFFEDFVASAGEADRVSVALLLADAQFLCASGTNQFAYVLTTDPEDLSPNQEFLKFAGDYTLNQWVAVYRDALALLADPSAAGGPGEDWLTKFVKAQVTRRRVDAIQAWHRAEKGGDADVEHAAVALRNHYKDLQDLQAAKGLSAVLTDGLGRTPEGAAQWSAAVRSALGPVLSVADLRTMVEQKLERAEAAVARAEADVTLAKVLREYSPFLFCLEPALSGNAEGFAVGFSSTHNHLGPAGNFNVGEIDWMVEMHRNLSAKLTTLAGVSGQTYLDGLSRRGQTEDGNATAPAPTGGGSFALVGQRGLAVMGVNDRRPLLDTPQDTPAAINFASLGRQATVVQGFLAQAALQPTIIPRPDMTAGPLRVRGRTLTFDLRAGLTPNEPVPNAVVYIPRLYANSTLAKEGKTAGGMRLDRYTISDGDGKFEFVMMEHRDRLNPNYRVPVNGFRIDRRTASISMATDFGIQGAIKESYRNWIDAVQRDNTLSLVMFDCAPLEFYDFVDPRYLNTLTKMRVLDASTGSEPLKYSYVTNSGLKIGKDDALTEIMGVLFAPPGTRLKILMSQGLIGVRMVLLNATAANPEGEGFAVGPNARVLLTSLQAANDFWHLNHSRMSKLAQFGIRNETLDQLQATAERQLTEARSTLATSQPAYSQAYQLGRSAWGLTARAYPDVKSMADDAVVGVVFYLATLVPFAWFMERLTFRAKNANLRMAGMAGWFAAVFIVLYYVHPAFKIALSPLIILLAFIMFLLAVVVLSIVLRKFTALMRAYRERTGGIHSADVSRASAILVAISLSLSNMNKRKVRTVLTGATLTLLSFAIVSFTSITNRMDPYPTPVPDTHPAYNGLMFHMEGWSSIPQAVLTTMQTEFAPRAPGASAAPGGGPLPNPVVVGRYWFLKEEKVWSAQQRGANTQILRRLDGKQTSKVNGVVGLEPAEAFLWPVDRLVTGRFFKPGEDFASEVILPDNVAKELGITPADVAEGATPRTILLAGQKLKVIGILDARAADAARDINGQSLAPVDYAASGVSGNENKDTADGGQVGLDTVAVHKPWSEMAIVPWGMARQMGGQKCNLKSIAVRFPDGEDGKLLVERLMQRLAVNLFAALDGQSYLYTSVGVSSVKASAKLLVPILIAILIILNTMLGTVAERVDEIGMYNAVGLAPGHVTMLFLVEGAVYANLGVVLGFLLGQAVCEVNLHYPFLKSLSLNYSGSATVMANLIIITVTLLSTWYPARKAGRMATPGLVGKWKLPEPDGPRLNLRLPFTLTAGNAVGIFAFLEEYFSSHSEATSPDFRTAALRCQMVRTDPAHPPALAMSFRCWLAPYDLAVSQDCAAYVEPTEHAGIYQVRFTLERLSGDMNAWLRTNTAFLNLIRKQFLIWRTISAESKADYLGRARQLFGMDGVPAAGRDPGGPATTAVAPA